MPPDRDDLEAVVEEMRTLASASKLMPETLRAWADRLDACITSDKPATNSEVEAVAHAIDDAIHPADPWAVDPHEPPQPRTVAETAIATLDAYRAALAHRDLAVDRPASPAPREAADDGE